MSNAVPPGGDNRLIRIPTTGNGAIDGSCNPSMNDTVFSLTQKYRNRLSVAGQFNVAGGFARNGLAGYIAAGGDCIFASGFDSP